MKRIKLVIATILMFSGFLSFGQTNDRVEMATVLRQDGKIYTVVFALVVILTGLIFFMLRVERKLITLEKEISAQKM